MWNLEGESVKATYLGDIPVSGKVTLSRVKYGGGVSHYVRLDHEIKDLCVYRAAGDTVIVDHKDVEQVFS
jgi:hypothetical protein